jgi:transketolase
MSMDIRDALFDTIYDLAATDNRVVFLTADADAFALRKFKRDFPERFINVGVAEQNMVTVATGLALSGKHVYIYSIISFVTMRCYEQIKFNICGMNLPITIIGLGAGFSFEFDGPSHHGVADIGVMRLLPEMTIYNPCDALSASLSARLSYSKKTPSYIRLDKGSFPDIYMSENEVALGLKAICPPSPINLISTGYMTHKALIVADALKKRRIQIGVIDICRLKPLPEEALMALVHQSVKLLTVEEHSILGGLGTAVGEMLLRNSSPIPLRCIALPDSQCFKYGSRDWLLDQYSVNTDAIIQIIEDNSLCQQ